MSSPHASRSNDRVNFLIHRRDRNTRPVVIFPGGRTLGQRRPTRAEASTHSAASAVADDGASSDEAGASSDSFSDNDIGANSDSVRSDDDQPSVYDRLFFSADNLPSSPTKPRRYYRKKENQFQRWQTEVIPSLVELNLKFMENTQSFRHDPTLPKVACKCREARKLRVVLVGMSSTLIVLTSLQVF